MKKKQQKMTAELEREIRAFAEKTGGLKGLFDATNYLLLEEDLVSYRAQDEETKNMTLEEYVEEEIEMVSDDRNEAVGNWCDQLAEAMTWKRTKEDNDNG